MKNAIGRIVGMLHAPALPGSPRNELDFNAILDWVLQDAAALTAGGVNALILENFGDSPFYPRRVPPHTVAFMTVLAREVRLACKLPLGINVLRNDAESAIAIASAVAAQFIRVNIHTGARLTDQGLIEGSAHETLRYRKLLGSDIRIFADVDVKHSAPLAARGLQDEVEETVSRAGADAIIVSGAATGKQTAMEDLKAAKAAARTIPVYAGSGVDAGNIRDVLEITDGAIIGTALKQGSVTANRVDEARVRALIESIERPVKSSADPELL
jgi:uncharacterized protein